jgi:serine/threonine-protein kinase
MSDENVLLKASLYDGNITVLLLEAGQIFKVFNQQDSGCISYGIEAMGQCWFVKYAERAEAIAFMQNAERLHRAVAHPRLPKLLNSIHTSEGFALVYEWVDGEVLGTPEFPGKEGRSSPQSPHYRFRQLPVHKIIAALSAVYEVHAYLESEGVVAVDFYDGSMIYDFDRDELHLCDLDCYAQGAFTLEMDRLYGSSRFMAPEEFVKGSRIDHLTNVFTMGAAAFVFLADEGSRDSKDWLASETLYRIACKAASADRKDRYGSVAAFYHDWLEAAVKN